MNGHRQQGGFTIIEVSMVIALMGLLLVGVLTGIGFAVERQRFTDSVFSTEVHLKGVYDKVFNVFNDRRSKQSCTNPSDITSGTYVGSDTCIILGRIVVFLYDATNDSTVIQDHAVIGTKAPNTDDATSTYDSIRSTDPIVLGSPSDDNYSIPWGALVRNIRDKGDAPTSGTSPFMFAILRSPKDGTIGVYKIKNNLGAAPADPILNPAGESSAWKQAIDVTPAGSQIAEADKELQGCIASSSLNGAEAALIIRPTGSQDGVMTLFDQDKDLSGACSHA